MLNRGSEVKQDLISNPSRTNFLQSRGRYLKVISAASFAIGYLLAATVNLVFFSALLVPLILAIAYTIGSKKFARVLGSSRLKDKLLVKNLVISFGWSLIPLLVGLYYGSVPLVLLGLVPFVFLRLMSNTVFFDLRDVRADAEFGVRTIPVVYGIDLSYRMMNLVDIASGAYVALLVLTHFFPIYTIVLVLFPIYSIFYRSISRLPTANLDFLCDFVADGEYLFWGPLMFLGKSI